MAIPPEPRAPREPNEPLDVGRLRTLREVGRRGSIAAAARALGVTASAVSQQLTLLERETGASLLERSSRGVLLTGAGDRLAQRAAAIDDLLAEARADLDRLTDSPAGRVRLAAVASAATTVLDTAVLALREQAPQLEVSVVVAEPERGIGLLLTGDVDIAIVDEYDGVPVALPDGADVRQLADEPMVLVRADDGRRRRTPPLSALAEASWVMPPEDAACGRAVRGACRTVGFEPRVRWQTDDMLALTRAVASGHGVAVLPRRAAMHGVGVTSAPLREPTLRRRVLAVCRGASAGRPVVAAVLDALAAAAGADRRRDGRPASD